MHYGAYTYAIDGSIPTMVAKNGKKDMGSPNGFSRVSLGSSFSYDFRKSDLNLSNSYANALLKLFPFSGSS
jgi:hypothetical protein